MPLYDYRCRRCSAEFELLVLKSTVPACPTCQSAELDQLISGFAVSSSESRMANARSARKAAVTNSNFREQQIAHAKYVKNHVD